MDYLILLDYEHLDNGFFLKKFANALSRRKNGRAIILHSDSPYTERIMQSGVMREEAQIRSLKDLNNRLVALMADYGVPVTGLNGYQRDIMFVRDGLLNLNKDYLNSLPANVHILINALVSNKDKEKVCMHSFAEIASSLITSLGISEVLAFSTMQDDEIFTGGSSEAVYYHPDTPLSKDDKEIIPSDLQKMPFSFQILRISDLRD